MKHEIDAAEKTRMEALAWEAREAGINCRKEPVAAGELALKFLIAISAFSRELRGEEDSFADHRVM